MIVRRALTEDADALTACLVAAYAPYQSFGLPPVTVGIAEDIRDHSVWVAEVDGNTCGGIVMNLGDQSHVANLAVHPDAGGHGIGKALLDQACLAARAAGYVTIHLATHVDMTATQAFYRKLGWEETGRSGQKVYFQRELV